MFFLFCLLKTNRRDCVGQVQNTLSNWVCKDWRKFG